MPADERVIEGFLTRPCDLLTSRQIASLDLLHVQAAPRGAGPVDGLGSLVCTADRPVPGASPEALASDRTDEISILPESGSDELSKTVSLSSPPETVTRLTMLGLPAALIMRPTFYERCSLEVRIAPEQGFNVTVGRGPRRGVDDACDVARTIGEAVTANLPRRS